MARRISILAAAALLSVVGAPRVAIAEPTEPVPTASVTASVVDNPFLPEEEALDDCISAVPRPGCGSDARGGWRQLLVLGVLVLALGVIGWRISRAMRREPQADPDDGASLPPR